MEVVGGTKKGCIYGVGDLTATYPPKGVRSSFGARLSRFSTQEAQELQDAK